MARLHGRVVVPLLTIVLFTGGCETSFEAFSETDRYFSVFGYLDVMADVQWVRVELLQDSTLVGGALPEARVTTRNLETGEQVVWQDTLIHLSTGHTLPAFWTEEEIEPAATYRFVVEGKQGSSTAEVTTPERYPPPEVIGTVPGIGEEGGAKIVFVIVRNVDRLGAVGVFYRYLVCKPLGCAPRQRVFHRHLADTTRRDDGSLRIAIPWQADVERTLGPKDSFAGFYVFRVRVASVGTWPDYELPVDSLQAAPQPPVLGLASNIEHGTGFLGGAAVRTVHVPIKQ